MYLYFLNGIDWCSRIGTIHYLIYLSLAVSKIFVAFTQPHTLHTAQHTLHKSTTQDIYILSASCAKWVGKMMSPGTDERFCSKISKIDEPQRLDERITPFFHHQCTHIRIQFLLWSTKSLLIRFTFAFNWRWVRINFLINPFSSLHLIFNSRKSFASFRWYTRILYTV